MTDGAKLQSKILRFLEQNGAYAVKIVVANRAGTPDILACFGGRFFAFEVKGKGDSLKRLQEMKLEAVKKAGGNAYVITDFEQFLGIFNHFLEVLE